jgi:hypothetical protein
VVEGRDFFISYTGINRAWAEWIAVELERVGYSTVLQAWDFAPGTDFVHKMQEATRTSARTVAVLSPTYFDSRFGATWRCRRLGCRYSRAAPIDRQINDRGDAVDGVSSPCNPVGTRHRGLYEHLGLRVSARPAADRVVAGGRSVSGSRLE